MSITPRTIAASVVLAILVGLPFGLGHYGYYILAIIMIYAMVALGLNVLIGMGGQISIGHADSGRWAHTLRPCRWSSSACPSWSASPSAASVAALFGALVALPALRVQGHYLAIATLGFALFVQQVLFEWEWLTGGRQGLFVPRPSLFGVELAERFQLLLCPARALPAARLGDGQLRQVPYRPVADGAQDELDRGGMLRHSPAQAHHYRLRHQRVLHGRIRRALRPSPGASQHRDILPRGVPVVPDHGGDRRAAFARRRIARGSYLALAPEVLREFKDAQMVIYGVTLVLFVQFLPGGLISLVERAWRAVRRTSHGAP